MNVIVVILCLLFKQNEVHTQHSYLEIVILFWTQEDNVQEEEKLIRIVIAWCIHYTYFYLYSTNSKIIKFFTFSITYTQDV